MEEPDQSAEPDDDVTEMEIDHDEKKDEETPMDYQESSVDTADGFNYN